MLCKVWKRREKKITCLMQHPWFYSLPFFVFAFGKNTTKNVHLLNGLFCLYDFTCFPGCCVIVLLIFLKNCDFFGECCGSFPCGPHDSLMLTCSLSQVCWFSGLMFISTYILRAMMAPLSPDCREQGKGSASSSQGMGVPFGLYNSILRERW